MRMRMRADKQLLEEGKRDFDTKWNAGPRNTAALDEFERLKTIGTGTQRLCARERSLERTLTSTTRLTISVRHVRVRAGSFGRVMLVARKANRQQYFALKILDKAKVRVS